MNSGDFSQTLPPDLVQEMFFECVEAMVRKSKRKENLVKPSDQVH